MHASPSLLIVDDHPIIRAALADALRKRFPRLRLESVGDAESGIALLKQELKKRKAQPWWVLIDLGLPGMSGLAAITQLLALNDAVQVIAISGNDDALQVGACFGAGAAAFISKAAPTDDAITIVAQAVEGTLIKGTWLSARGLADSAALNRIALTERQVQVLSMICQGMSNREIADQLGITEITAKSHVGGIFRELHVASRTQAVLVAQKLGLFANNH
ncbi:MAG: response regulator transcription factor [Burkholderiaceae bacterium]